MTASLREQVNSLEHSLPALERMRTSTPLANDVYEAAVYWRDLGQWVLDRNTKVNYPARAAEERRLLERLKGMASTRSVDEQQLYEAVFTTASAVLDAVSEVALERDGHLGILRIIGENFGFLETDYGFAVVDRQPIGMKFSSSAVWIELKYAERTNQCCTFGPVLKANDTFWPEDLLFLYGDERYREVQNERLLKSVEELIAWFRLLAEIWRTNGQEVLTNRPGIFDRLARAQAQRDAELTAAMDAQYGRHP